MARIRWIPEARSVRMVAKMFSVQAMATAGAINLTWVSLPTDLKSALDPKFVAWLSIGIVVAGIFGRLVDQNIETGGSDGQRG